MGSEKRRRWPGGYIHRQKDGRDLFIIEREVGGALGQRKRFHVSTRTHSLRAAMKQLERFEANPYDYHPEGEQPDEPVHLTAELADAFWDHQVEEKGVSRKHANEVGKRLEHWIQDLARVDLRQATLRDHIVPALDGRGSMRGARISTIKAFYGWLRTKKHLLTSEQDPTLDLSVPQSLPEKRRRRKVVELERVQAAFQHLEGAYRDCLLVMAATGWHFTELSRFIRNGESEIIRVKEGATVAVLQTLHKSKEQTRTPITDEDVLAAAVRLRARGKVPKRPNAALKEACRKAEVEAFTFGVMRHTVGTWAKAAGASKEVIAEFLQHKDPRTTERFYIDLAVPTATVPLPKLRLVEGKKTG